MITAEGVLMLLVWWIARLAVRWRGKREVRRLNKMLDAELSSEGGTRS